MTTTNKHPRPSLIELLDSLEPIDEDFPEIEELPLESVELQDVEPGSDVAFS